MAPFQLAANLSLAVGIGVSLVVATVAWRNRPAPGACWLAGFMASVALWETAHLLAHVAPPGAAPVFDRLRWLAVAALPLLWLGFVLDYTGRRDLLGRRALVVVVGWPLFVFVLLWIPVQVPGADATIWTQVRNEAALVFWGQVSLAYGLLAVGSVLLVHDVYRAGRLFRRQGWAVLLGLGFGWAGSVVSLFELFGDMHLHAATLGLTLLGIPIVWAVFRADLTDISPIARSTVLDTMSVGILVLDRDDRVTDVNPAARELFGFGDEPVVGRPLASVLPAWVDPDALAADGGNASPSPAVEMDAPTADSERRLAIRVSPVAGRHERPLGRVLIVSDVTEEARQRRELERQNRRLDEFASVLSHDLRNPLGVARGYLDLGREQVDEDIAEFERVARAHERMEELIEATLSLARQGEPVGEPSEVDLAATARDAWTNVDTDSATLETLSGLSTVEGNAERLRRLFENLFRNAVEHGGEGVTVRVGPLDDHEGFFVADDGPGIPAEERETIFERGVTTTDGNTGFGLAIVKSIVEAHDWEIRAVDADGARFEVTGVDR